LTDERDEAEVAADEVIPVFHEREQHGAKHDV